ncbi:MAG: helix-turn-helix domain-containing protein [Lachnospiraceae bacterium]|nr:helix-turn-helix domain-containing protein [Lachnospiraceae bacterium]
MNSINPLSPHLRGRKIPQFADSVFIDEDHSKKHSILPHVHRDFLELYFVYSGKNRYMVDNRYYDLHAGDIVICNANTLHGESPSDSRQIRSYSVALKDVFLSDLPKNTLCPPDEVPILSTGLLSEQIGSLFYMINVLSADMTHLGDTVNTMSASLLLLTYEMLLSRRKIQTKKTTSSSVARRVQEYIDAHYHETITLADIGRELSLSEYYLAHAFKNEYNVPPMQYMMERRIGEAQQLLMSTDLPIGDIAESLGFSSVSHFNTMFSKYVAISPGKFRKSIQAMNQ